MWTILGVAILLLGRVAEAAPLPEPAAALYARAHAAAGERARAVDLLAPEVIASADGRSFALAWQPSSRPQGWIVTLHGSEGSAFNDIALWHAAATARGLGVVAWQWWYGTGGQAADYASPDILYRDIDLDLRRRGTASRGVLLHGFSRGSSNTYALAALDAVGSRHFGAVLANAGGATPDYPPNRRIAAGAFGAKPYAGLKFITYCGGSDPNPDRDGCPAMSRTGDWVSRFGGEVVLALADPVAGHGGFQRTLTYLVMALDTYLRAVAAH